MLTIYCAEPVAVTADELRSIAGDANHVKLDGSVAEIGWPGCQLKINPMPDGELDAHLRGFVGFLSAHGTTDSLLERARGVKQVLGIVLDDEAEDASHIWEVVEGLASKRRGFLFAPDGIFEVDGTPLLPFHLALDEAGDDGTEWNEPDDDDDWDSPPPTPARIARRALALAAVVMRAHLDSGEGFTDPDAQYSLLVAWLQHNEIMDELEPDERALIDAPLGTATERQVIEASWRAEGMVVLAWALGVAEIPDHDTLTDPVAVANALGLLGDEKPEILTGATIVSAEKLSWLQDRLLGLHWRLRDYRVSPKTMNYREFAADCWFGSFDIGGVALVKDDLAIEGEAIHHAPDHAVSRTESIAMERHQAINWLLGWDDVYSEVDTAT